MRMVLEPEKSLVMGGTWRIPVLVGLQSKTFIKDQKEDGTFNEAAFEREYESRWSGTIEDAFFNGEIFDRNRKLLQPEKEHSVKTGSQAYYVLAVDVGRKGWTYSCPCKISLIAGISYLIRQSAAKN